MKIRITDTNFAKTIGTVKRLTGKVKSFLLLYLRHWSEGESNPRPQHCESVFAFFAVLITEPVFVSISAKRAYVSRLKRLCHYNSLLIIVNQPNHVCPPQTS